MRTLTKSLMTVTAVLSLSPLAALALPPQCSDICLPDAYCADTCAMGRFITTCEEYLFGNCQHLDAPEDTSASLMTEDVLAPVCSEQNPTAELAVSAES